MTHKSVFYPKMRDNVSHRLPSKDFVAKYDLGSPASVLPSLEALSEKEMIYADYSEEGQGDYCVYDELFRCWMEGR
jgi:hypothetical protein